jgi:hypothetical protein
MTKGAPFPIDPVLTGIIVNYRNAEFIADKVFPRLSPRLNKQQFKWWKFDFGQMVTRHDSKVGRKGTPKVIELEGQELDASTDDYGFSSVVPADDVNQAPDGYDPRQFHAQALYNFVLMEREVRAAEIAFDEATYDANNKETLSGSSQWSHVDSDPIMDVGAARESMVMKPNKLLLGSGTWFALRTNPAILKSISVSGTDKGMATLAAVTALLEFDEIIVGQSKVNASKPGQTPVLANAWGNHALMYRQEPLASSNFGVATFGWTAEYMGPVANQDFNGKIGLRGAYEVKAGESVKEVVSSADLGYFFEDAAA